MLEGRETMVGGDCMPAPNPGLPGPTEEKVAEVGVLRPAGEWAENTR